NAELDADTGVDARRRNRPDDDSRALADARHVRRLGRVFRVRAVPLPARREPHGRLRGGERQIRQVHRSRRRHRRSRAAGRLRDRLLTALRPRSFPHARLPDDSERRRVSKVARRSGKGTAAGPSDADGPVSTKLGGATKRGHVSQALEVSLPPYETPPNAWRVKIHAAAAEAMRAAGIVYSETEWLAVEVQL